MVSAPLGSGVRVHKEQELKPAAPRTIASTYRVVVQAVLAGNRVARATGARTKQPSLLTGMIFDEAGERLTPTWSIKKVTQYRYVCRLPS